jgi:hypothetical protein
MRSIHVSLPDKLQVLPSGPPGTLHLDKDMVCLGHLKTGVFLVGHISNGIAHYILGSLLRVSTLS